MAIDDRISKIREIADEQDEELLAALVPLGAIFSPILSVVSIVKTIIDNGQAHHRVRTAIRALCDELESMRNSIPADAAASLNSTWFKRAVQVLIEESLRAPDIENAVKLARAAAHGFFPDTQNAHRQEDLASYLRDITRLGTDDIQMLKLLRDVHQDAIKRAPNLTDPNEFAPNYARFKRDADQLKIHPDDSISLGARLSGFGLAYEIARVQTAQSPGEHAFRPTRRGLYLLTLLDAAETPQEKQD